MSAAASSRIARSAATRGSCASRATRTARTSASPAPTGQSSDRALLPIARVPTEPRAQLRLRLDGLRGFLGGRLDLLLQLVVIGQPGELIDEDHRLLRRDLELPAAGLADDLVVEAENVVAQLRELLAIHLVGPRGRTIFLHPPDPADAVVVGAAAFRARVAARLGLGLVGEEGAFVEGHAFIVSGAAVGVRLTGRRRG